MKKTAKSFTLGDDSLKRLEQLTSDYGLRSLSACVENCIGEMPTPTESKAFDALLDRLYENYAGMAEMISRRSNIMYRFALLIGRLGKAGNLSNEDFTEAMELAGAYGPEEDMATEAFVAAVPAALKKADYRTAKRK